MRPGGGEHRDVQRHVDRAAVGKGDGGGQADPAVGPPARDEALANDILAVAFVGGGNDLRIGERHVIRAPVTSGRAARAGSSAVLSGRVRLPRIGPASDNWSRNAAAIVSRCGSVAGAAPPSAMIAMGSGRMRRKQCVAVIRLLSHWRGWLRCRRSCRTLCRTFVSPQVRSCRPWCGVGDRPAPAPCFCGRAVRAWA